MTTSGSIDFSVSRDNLIEDALRAAGALGVEDSASSTQLSHAARILNMIVKAWGAYGPALWARSTQYLLPVSDTNTVTMSASGGHVTGSYTQTTLGAAAASGATTITVASATGFGSGYYVGIELSDGSMSWHVQTGAAAGLVITLTVALAAAADSGAYVYVYQTKANRVLRVIDAYSLNLDSDNSTPIEIVPLQDYNQVGYKPSESSPFQLTYDPQLNSGTIYIYPRFSIAEEIIVLTCQRTFEDFDAASDTPDFPQEWYFPMYYALAVALAPTYGLPVQDRAALKSEAKAALDLVLGNEPEEGSYRIMPRDR